METLGSVLKQRRQELRYSLREVAEKAGISNPYLSQIENHKITSPSPSVLKKLAELYSVSYNKLLELAGHPTTGDTEAIALRTSAGSHPISKEEGKELLEYLQFIRTRRGRK